MHAVAVSVNIEPDKMDEAGEELKTNVLPRVKESPGLVAAYWLEPDGGYGYALLVYDSEEHANAAKQMAENAPRPDFLKLGNVQVMPVIANL